MSRDVDTHLHLHLHPPTCTCTWPPLLPFFSAPLRPHTLHVAPHLLLAHSTHNMPHSIPLTTRFLSPHHSRFRVRSNSERVQVLRGSVRAIRRSTRHHGFPVGRVWRAGAGDRREDQRDGAHEIQVSGAPGRFDMSRHVTSNDQTQNQLWVSFSHSREASFIRIACVWKAICKVVPFLL